MSDTVRKMWLEDSSNNKIAPNTLTTAVYDESGTNLDTILTNKVSSNAIVDNLTTDDATKVLSAKQGKVLNGGKVNKVNPTSSGELYHDGQTDFQIADHSFQILGYRNAEIFEVKRNPDSAYYDEETYINTTAHIAKAEITDSLTVNGKDILTTLNGKQDKLIAGTNISFNSIPTGVIISATDTKYSVATTSANGLMSSTDKTKLDGIAEGATANNGTVTSVAVKMNDEVKGTVTESGTIDLGTVITAHQDISGKVNTTNPTSSGTGSHNGAYSIWQSGSTSPTLTVSATGTRGGGTSKADITSQSINLIAPSNNNSISLDFNGMSIVKSNSTIFSADSEGLTINGVKFVPEVYYATESGNVLTQLYVASNGKLLAAKGATAILANDEITADDIDTIWDSV